MTDMIYNNASANHKKPRKRRKVKNGIVNIDDDVAPGLDNVNWVNESKQKLMERECKLLQKRQKICDDCIIASIHQFTQHNTNIRDDILETYHKEIRAKIIGFTSTFNVKCVVSITNILNKWKGFRSDRNIQSFRVYWKHSRGWFDRNKISIIAKDFWIPMMQFIDEFAKASASHCFDYRQPELHNLYSNCLYTLILKNLLEAKIQLPNTRSLWLIPAMCYEIFVQQYNDKLQVIISNDTLCSKKHSNIRDQYLQSIYVMYTAIRKAFDTKMNKCYNSLNVEPTLDLYPSSNLNFSPSSNLSSSSNSSASYDYRNYNTQMYGNASPPMGDIYQNASPSMGDIYQNTSPSMDIYQNASPMGDIYQNTSPSMDIYQNASPSIGGIYHNASPSSQNIQYRSTDDQNYIHPQYAQASHQQMVPNDMNNANMNQYWSSPTPNPVFHPSDTTPLSSNSYNYGDLNTVNIPWNGNICQTASCACHNVQCEQTDNNHVRTNMYLNHHCAPGL